MTQSDAAPMKTLLDIMARLRNPDGGCPWDVEQDFKSIAPYTIEEAYEVADAIDREDYPDLQDELGDLLFQVVFHAQMAKEAGLFDFDDVCRSISEKMIRRHPHVFADAAERDSDTQTEAWEEQKAKERAEKSKDDSVLDDIPVALPALKRAQKLQKRAARVGFDWPSPDQVLDKIEEEIAEVREAMTEGNADHVAEEVGDLLFVCTNLGRKLKVDVEASARAANAKFERRFRHIETRLSAEGRTPEMATLDEMEALWVEAKLIEKKGPTALSA